MKKLKLCSISLGLCILLFNCCDTHKYDEVEIVDRLDELLSDYISKHNVDSIIMLDFWKTENHIDMIILHEPFYYEDMVDGCFEKQGKLVVFNSDYKGLIDSLIISSDSINYNLLKKYKTWPKGIFYDGYMDICSYCIFRKDSIIENENFLHNYRKTNASTDGINSSALNKLINTELNNRCDLVISLHFAEVDNEIYLCVNGDRFYDSNGLDGCIYRNSRMITIHSGHVHGIENIIDLSLVKRDLPKLAKFKKSPRRNMFSKITDRNTCYKFISQDSIVPVDDTNELENIICPNNVDF